MKETVFNTLGIMKDIKEIDERVEGLKSGGGKCSTYAPHAASMAIAELLKAKAQLIQASKCYD